MDEFLAHQTSDTFDHVGTSDRNFYDRHYFNCHASSDEIFLITGMGQYPNLGVTDAFVCVSYGDRQYTVRASRELGSDRLDTSVGPFSVEVIEGLRSLRVRCEPTEHEVSFDLRWEGSVPALEEPRTFIRRHGRIQQDVSRYAQVGTWQGSISVAGRSFEVTPDRWKGARDRSWGVRPVGEPVPPGIGVKDFKSGPGGFWHNWMPMQFDDCMLKVMVDEDGDGNRIVEEAARVWNLGIDKGVEALGHAEIDITYRSGTREIERAVTRLTHPSGQEIRATSIPLRTLYLFAGSGYRYDGEWGHGVYQGPLKVEGVVHDMSTPGARAPWVGLNETLCRFELDSGEVGHGMHENLCVGVYRPAGFERPDSVAP